MNRLGEWIAAQLKERGMSQREFAGVVGVSHVTVGRAMQDDAPTASPEFVMQLARATHTDVIALFLLAYPEAKALANDSAAARLAGDQFDKLPDEVKVVVSGLFAQWSGKNSK